MPGPTPAVQIGKLRLTGPAAMVALALVLGLLVAVLVSLKPALRMVLTAAIWLLFMIYWSAAARGTAAPVTSESAGSRLIHTRLLSISLLLLFVPVPGLRGRFVPLGALVIGVGLAVQGLGFALAVWARRRLGRYWSGAVALSADHQLIRAGPYRRVRHPIYSAMFVMYIGTALVSGEWHAALALAILSFAYARKIPQEERALREHFGAAYDAYRKESWALIPGLF